MDYKWIRYTKYDSLLKPKAEPKVDKYVSQIVGKKVFANDKRLVNLVIKWKKGKDSENWDNFLHRPECREELKKVFNS